MTQSKKTKKPTLKVNKTTLSRVLNSVKINPKDDPALSILIATVDHRYLETKAIELLTDIKLASPSHEDYKKMMRQILTICTIAAIKRGHEGL
jgi:hypothetical protein